MQGNENSKGRTNYTSVYKASQFLLSITQSVETISSDLSEGFKVKTRNDLCKQGKLQKINKLQNSREGREGTDQTLKKLQLRPECYNHQLLTKNCEIEISLA